MEAASIVCFGLMKLAWKYLSSSSPSLGTFSHRHCKSGDLRMGNTFSTLSCCARTDSVSEATEECSVSSCFSAGLLADLSDQGSSLEVGVISISDVKILYSRFTIF